MKHVIIWVINNSSNLKNESKEDKQNFVRLFVSQCSQEGASCFSEFQKLDSGARKNRSGSTVFSSRAKADEKKNVGNVKRNPTFY